MCSLRALDPVSLDPAIDLRWSLFLIGFLETIEMSSASAVTKLEHFLEIMNQCDVSRCGPHRHPAQNQNPNHPT